MASATGAFLLGLLLLPGASAISAISVASRRQAPRGVWIEEPEDPAALQPPAAQEPEDCRSIQWVQEQEHDSCHQAISWAITTGYNLNPKWYPDVKKLETGPGHIAKNNNWRNFQASLFSRGKAGCHKPCPPGRIATTTPAAPDLIPEEQPVATVTKSFAKEVDEAVAAEEGTTAPPARLTQATTTVDTPGARLPSPQEGASEATTTVDTPDGPLPRVDSTGSLVADSAPAEADAPSGPAPLSKEKLEAQMKAEEELEAKMNAEIAAGTSTTAAPAAQLSKEISPLLTGGAAEEAATTEPPKEISPLLTGGAAEEAVTTEPPKLTKEDREAKIREKVMREMSEQSALETTAAPQADMPVVAQQSNEQMSEQTLETTAAPQADMPVVAQQNNEQVLDAPATKKSETEEEMTARLQAEAREELEQEQRELKIKEEMKAKMRAEMLQKAKEKEIKEAIKAKMRADRGLA